MGRRDRSGPPGDRPARGRARAPAGPGRAALHRRGALVRRDPGAPGAPSGGALLRQGGGEQGARDGRAAPARHRGGGRRRRAAARDPARRGGGARRGARRRRPHLADAHEVDGGRGGGAAVTLPPWLQGLPDPERMRATDRWAIEEQGIAGQELMERAGRGLADLVASVAPDGPVAIACGKGNNGGDGYVAARLLRETGRAVRVLAGAPVSELSGDARANPERVDGVQPFAVARLADCSVAVDALLGTGFSGTPHGAVAEAIVALNDAGLPIVAADVPSGVDAASGVVEGAAIRARATATFAAAKPGLWINPGKSHGGTVRVIDIGIPTGAPIDEPDVALIADAELLPLLPSRAAGWTKFTSGHVLVAGGARGLTGAPSLACEAAQRAGAGYVTACVPASLETIFEVRLLEVMTRGLPDHDGAHTEAGVDAVLELAQRGGALVAGPGIGRTDGAVAFVRRLVREAEVPVLLDADGLNAHAGELGVLAGRPAATVLTPHEGELGRLLGVDSDAVK